MKTKVLFTISAVLFLAACGDDTTTEKIVEVAGGTVIVESVADLPECTKDNEGELVLVTNDASLRVCANGKWFATKDSLNAGDFSCTTKELKDKSGIKIVCNGDSIGVVLNGSDGKDGKAGTSGKDGDDGAGCAVVDQTDSTVVVKCGGQTMTLNLGAASGLDSQGLDSERISVSLDTLAGVSQKGPFLKGSTVYLYELSDGRTLKQTNGNFVSNITSDDGRFRFTTRNLMSQYALIVVDGKYRNEVTGKPTETAIRMQAYTDVLNRKNANVNLLTQLEMNRVYYLVTKEQKRFKVAKHQAQMEIFNAFHIDTTVIDKSSEDLNVFGNTEADAALLAISIMLQGDSNETALSVLLTEIADDMESDGKWDDSVTRARIADWALAVDSAETSSFEAFRVNVEKWGLSGTVPGFEKYLRGFVAEENGLGLCGDKVPVGTVKNVSNKKSDYNANGYSADDSASTKIRFICRNEKGKRWRVATDIEKDTMGLGHRFKVGEVAHGKVNKDSVYVYENNNWRHGTSLDGIVKKGCVSIRKDTVAQGTDETWYKCIGDTTMKVNESAWMSAWRKASDIEMDTAGLGHEFRKGDIIHGNVNKDLIYVYENNNWRHGTLLDGIVGKGCVPGRKDTVALGTDGIWYKCIGDTAMSMDESAWKSAWRKASNIEMDTATWGLDKCDRQGKLYNGNVNKGLFYVCDDEKYRSAVEMEVLWNKGCVSYNWGEFNKFEGESYQKCIIGGTWTSTVDGDTGKMQDSDGIEYKIVVIGDLLWMAENLKKETENSYCYRNSKDSCDKYGRLYTWAGAMDSLGVYSSDGKGCGYRTSCSPTYPVRGVCPEGWHLPDTTEWHRLIMAAGGHETGGLVLKSQTDWEDVYHKPKGNGTDALNFGALPAGCYDTEGNISYDAHNRTRFWSSTALWDDGHTGFLELTYDDNKALIWTSADVLYQGYPVRCVRND